MKKASTYTMVIMMLLASICYSKDISKIVEDVEKSVVVVRAFNSDSTSNNLGSGCFINNNGIILTNAHVIDSCFSLQIELTDTTIHVVDVLYKDKVKDLALLKINVDSSLSKALVFPVLNTYKVGSHVVAVGNPLGFERSVSDGIISGIRKVGDGVIYIQTTVPISSGSSGGVLLNDAGELIGITTSTAKRGQNVNFAVSSYTISIFLKEYSKQTNNQTFLESIKKPKFAFLRALLWLCKTTLGKNIYWIPPLIIIVFIALYLMVRRKTIGNILKSHRKKQDGEEVSTIKSQNDGKIVLEVSPNRKVTAILFQHKYYFMAGVIIILLLSFIGKELHDKYMLKKMLILGKGNIDKGNNETALEYLNKAIQYDNKNARAYFLRGWAQGNIYFDLRGEEFDAKRSLIIKSALEDFNKSIAIAPTDTAFSFRTDSKSLDWPYDSYAVLKYAEEHIKAFPNSILAYENMADALESIKDYSGQIECYTKILQLDAGQTKVYKERAHCYYYFLDDYTSAISDLNNYIKWFPSDPEGYRLRGTCYRALSLDYCDDNDRFTTRGLELLRMELADNYKVLRLAQGDQNYEISYLEGRVRELEQMGINLNE